MVVSRLRTLIALLVVALAGTLAAPAASPAKGHHKLPHRVGGKVHKAWPAKHVRGKRAKHPRKALSRFLAKQVGPTKLKVEKPKLMAARVSSAGPLVTFLPAATSTKLRLVRSFDVPADDPAAARMTNLSWTYDSAIAAIALISQNEKTQAEQLLGQLAALQRTDGSIDFAYNVANGSSLPVFDTGAIAWTGVAAATYRSTYDSDKYDALAGGTTQWLLNRRNPAGLLTGTPSATLGLDPAQQHRLVPDADRHRPSAVRREQLDRGQRPEHPGDRHQARPARQRQLDADGVRPGRRRLDVGARRPGARHALPRLRRRARQPLAGRPRRPRAGSCSAARRSTARRSRRSTSTARRASPARRGRDDRPIATRRSRSRRPRT